MNSHRSIIYRGYRAMLEVFRLRLVSILLLLLAAGAVYAANGANNASRITGKYKVQVVGSVTGTGTVIVSKKSVMFWCDIVDGNGRVGQIEAANLPLKNGRFHGQADIYGNMRIDVSGRIVAPDGEILSKPRISIMYVGGDVFSGRITGYREDSAK